MIDRIIDFFTPKTAEKIFFQINNSDASTTNYQNAHSWEKSRLKSMFECCNSNEELHSVIEELSESFFNITATNDDEDYLNVVWIKYLNLACQYSAEVPPSLLRTLSYENYIVRFSHMKKLLEKTKYRDQKPDHRNLTDQAVQICNWILEHINAQDAPSLLLLGQIYQKQNNFLEARFYYEQVIENSRSKFNGITALADCYEAEISVIKKERQHQIDCSAKIREINNHLEEIYRESIEELKQSINNSNENDIAIRRTYVSLVCKYARWSKSAGRYSGCAEILAQIDIGLPEYHRVLLEKGLLYQHKGHGRNPYYNLENAKECFVMAEQKVLEECLDKKEEIIALKSVLVPLANTFFFQKEYTLAQEICDRVLTLDPLERNALKLEQKIAEKKVSTA